MTSEQKEPFLLLARKLRSKAYWESRNGDWYDTSELKAKREAKAEAFEELADMLDEALEMSSRPDDAWRTPDLWTFRDSEDI